MRFTTFLTFALALGACDAPDPVADAGVDAGVDPSQIGVRFDPNGVGFYRLPWPSDARLTPRGTPDLSDFPDRRRLLDTTAAEIEANVRGFATMPVAYFVLSSPVGPHR